MQTKGFFTEPPWRDCAEGKYIVDDIFFSNDFDVHSHEFWLAQRGHRVYRNSAGRWAGSALHERPPD